MHTMKPKRVIIFVLFLCLPLYGATKNRKPNFIFVLSDDIAQGDLGCYGQKLIQTPRLDQMAAEGTRYLQAYCGTSVCAPSRSSFFTGLHTGHCPVRGNYEIAPEGQLPLPDKTVTIAEVAKSAGYATATFGKWGMGFFDSSGSPFKQGVDHFFGYNCQRHAHSYFPTYLYDDAQPFILPGNDGQGVGQTYAQELIQKDMIQWLRRHAQQPFMLFYAITLPHGRHEIDDYGIYRDKPWTDKQKAYAAQVTRVDSDMGELMDTLRALGIAKDTLIVFSGDNGSSFNPKSEIGRRFDQASNGLRGFKRGMYEGALRQAALAWWPGTVPAGRVDNQPWAFWDLLPTFVELSGATPPEGYETDGHSLVAYLKGANAPQRDYFYWELHLGDGAIQAARFGQWKAVRNGINQPIEIYDLSRDAGETTNLASKHPDLVQKAKDIFKAAHRPDSNWPLDRRTEEHTERSTKAWQIKRQRDKDKWIPENAVAAPPPVLQGVDAALQGFIDAGDISGVVSLVGHQGKIVHYSAMGLADRKPNRKMERSTLFSIASMTKPIVASALMILQDEGKLHVDDQIQKYLPEFVNVRLADGSPPRRPLTLRDALTHTSGLAGSQLFSGSLADAVKELVQRPLAFQPGEKWKYSPGLNVIGRVIEVVAKQPLDRFLAERVFAPLSMKNTTFFPTQKQRRDLATLYAPGESEGSLVAVPNRITDIAPDQGPNPSGGLYASAGDLFRFYTMILNKGHNASERILSEASVKVMTTPQTGDLKTGFTPGNGWGLGWCVIREPQGVTDVLSPGSFGHGGAFGTQAWLDPNSQTVYLLLIQRTELSNSDASPMRAAFQRAAKKALSAL